MTFPNCERLGFPPGSDAFGRLEKQLSLLVGHLPVSGPKAVASATLSSDSGYGSPELYRFHNGERSLWLVFHVMLRGRDVEAEMQWVIQDILEP